MTDLNLFWPIFTAVLSALLLAGSFFGAFLAYTRLEREGRELHAPFHLWIAMILPVLFLIAGMGIVFDKF